MDWEHEFNKLSAILMKAQKKIIEQGRKNEWQDRYIKALQESLREDLREDLREEIDSGFDIEIVEPKEQEIIEKDVKEALNIVGFYMGAGVSYTELVSSIKKVKQEKPRVEKIDLPDAYIEIRDLEKEEYIWEEDEDE